jgi:hypothetical protein
MAARDSRRLAVAIAIIVLTGITAFGLWHVVVGGMLHGNPRAAGFGLVLATLAASLLAIVIVQVRRRAPD